MILINNNYLKVNKINVVEQKQEFNKKVKVKIVDNVKENKGESKEIIPKENKKDNTNNENNDKDFKEQNNKGKEKIKKENNDKKKSINKKIRLLIIKKLLKKINLNKNNKKLFFLINN